VAVTFLSSFLQNGDFHFPAHCPASEPRRPPRASPGLSNELVLTVLRADLSQDRGSLWDKLQAKRGRSAGPLCKA